MFNSLVEQANKAINGTVDKLVGRAAVALPLLIATGFLTTAGMIELIDLYGAVTACLIAAGVFLVIALITAAFATNTLNEVEALVTGESAATTEDEQSAIPDLDITKMLTSDPVLTVSAASTAAGLLKSVNKRTAAMVFIVALGLALILMYLGRRSNGGETKSEDAATANSTPEAELKAA